MAKSEKAKALEAKQKEAVRAEKLRKKNSEDPRDWGYVRQMREAYRRTAEVDSSLPWWMAGAAAGAFLLVALIGFLTDSAWWMWLPIAIMLAVLVATIVLTQKVKAGMIKRFDGQVGSAEVALQLLNKKLYHYQMGIAATRHMDLVHRVVGPGGVVLLGEGQPGRLKPLLAGEARRHEQVSYGTPVTTLVLGNGGGQVKLGELQKTIEKMPRALQTHQVAEVQQRLRALDAVRPKAPVPRGPMPTPKGMNRAMRGR